MRGFLILLTALQLGLAATGQTAEDSVKATINRFFAGMKGADGAQVKATLTDSAILQTISRSRDGQIRVVTENLADFVTLIGTMKKDSADEQIRFDLVRVDGPLAMAWTPYQFYFNGKFSHCGVNSFQLVRLAGEWKIQYIIDTRRRQGCL